MSKSTPKTISKLSLSDVRHVYESVLPGTSDHSEDGALHIGGFALGEENSALTLTLLDIISRPRTDILGNEDFQKIFQMPLRRAQPPAIDDPIFTAPAHITSKKDRAIARGILFNRAHETYQTTLLRDQEKHRVHSHIVSTYRSGDSGYLRYGLETLEGIAEDDAAQFFFEKKQFHLPASARRRHCFITGGTGSGKSETLKYLISRDLRRKNKSAVIVLDPHGQLAEDVARFEMNRGNDRLIYIDPIASEGHQITLNPFSVSDTSLQALEVQGAHLLGALEQIVGSSFTINMSALAGPLIATLLHRPESDLTDLLRFLDNKNNRDLVEYGATKLPYDQHRNFFKTQFQSAHFEPSKAALRSRLQGLLNSPTIKAFTTGQSSFDLETALGDGKFLVFNLSAANVSADATRAIGQFIVALVQGYAIRRKTDQPSIYLYADECQYFISKTTENVLGESRKFGLHLILATQRTEQVGSGVLDAILGNVGVFLAGRNKGKTLNVMSRELGEEGDHIRQLKTGQFIVSLLGGPPVTIKVPLTGDKLRMSEGDWNRLLANQLATYYRSSREVPMSGTSKPQVRTKPANLSGLQAAVQQAKSSKLTPKS